MNVAGAILSALRIAGGGGGGDAGSGGGGEKMPGNLEKAIVADLGSVAKMKEEFVQAGVTQFGSGWCWLAV